MRNYRIYDETKATRFNYDKLVDDYLDVTPTVRCKKVYYSYDSSKGIYTETDLDEIQLDVARYYENQTGQSWTVKFKKEIIEKLRIRISDVEEMDFYKDMICVSNCVIDLLSGAVYACSPDFMFTHHVPVIFDESAKCPYFKTFLNQITLGNKKRRATLEEFMGLCLTRDIGFGTALLLKGNGSNGKSVFCNVLCSILGADNYTTVSLKDLSGFGSGKIPNKRLIIMTEISKSTSANLMTNELKQIITGERMDCNMKYKQNFDMRPFAKVLILTNHEVGFLNDDSEGALRRVFIVPFEYYVPADERDFQLEDKLMNEASGILNLALEGYRRLVKNGYQYSSKSESDKLIRDLIRTENPFRCFVKEKIQYAHGTFKSYSKILLEYKEWCNYYGVEYNKLDGREIFQEINNYFNIERRKSNGSRGIMNITFRE